MKIKTYFLALLVLTLAALPLAAQSSPTSTNTQGLFGTDADSFLDPNDYQDLEFDSFFSELEYADTLQLSYNTSAVNTDRADILSAGYAARLGGSLYLGIFYVGNPYQYWNSNSVAWNNVTALIGSESFGGILLNGGFQYTDVGAASATSFIFGAGWGKNFELGNGVLKPQVSLAYSGIGVAVSGAGTSGDTVAGSLGADWELASSGSAETVVSGLFEFIYFETYSIGGMSYKPTMVNFNGEIKRVYALSDKFSAGFGAGLDFDLLSQKMTIPSISTTKSNTSTITPYGIAAFTYKFNTPFSVNAGIRVGYTITATSVSGGGSTTIRWDGFDASPAFGGSFEPAPNFGVDFSYAPSGTYGANLGSITIAARIKK